MLLVLLKLELDPFAVAISMSVKLHEDISGLLLSATGVEPSGRLGEEHGTNADDTGEHHLDTDGDHPRDVALVFDTTTSTAGSNESTDGPHDVVETGDETTVSGVGDLDDVDGAGGGGNGDTETEEESTGLELTDTGGLDAGDLDNDTDDNDEGTDEHAHSSAPGIDSRADERNGADGTDLVHGSDNT